MMNRVGRRAQYIWLALLGVFVAALSLASVSGTAAISPVIALGMVVAYLTVLFLVIARVDLSQVGRSMPTVAANVRMTAAARKAAARAKSRAEYGVGTEESLMDIGFLVNDKRADGRWERRIGESASFDDGAVQPYIKIFVPSDRAERMAIVEYEFYDRSGNLQFSHQVQEYLRQGENLLLCDRQLALRGNEELGRSGTWDLRVKLDGSLIGLHDFSMSTSSEERRRQFAGDGEVTMNDLADHSDDEAPVSLEDLLREQARRTSRR